MKMKSRIKIFQLLAIVVILFASSCSDSFFDEQAGDRITPDQHYMSYIDAMVTMEGAITPLKAALPNLILIDGLRSDQMDVTNNADGYLQAINSQEFSADNPYLDASDYYKVIININEALLNINKVFERDRNFDAYVTHYYKGALIGERSWVYLQILKLYGKAVLIKDNMASLPSNLDQSTLSKEALLDTLINQTLPYIFDPNVDKHIEIEFPYELGGGHHYVNSKGVVGELYLEKGDYANAIKYLKMALESYNNSTGMYKVDKTYLNETWRNIFISAENGSSENIATFPYNMNEDQDNPLPKMMMYSDQFVVKPTQLLVDSFKNQVQLKGLIGDIARGMGVTIDTSSTGVPFINKYSVDRGEPLSSDIVYSRAADYHLLLAEALNRSGDEKTALIILNSGFSNEKSKPAAYFKWSSNLGVRGRAYLMPRVVPDSINVISGTDTTKIAFQGEDRIRFVEDLIMDERAMELAFEGKRWFDLVRVATRRNDPSYLADKVAAKFMGTPKYEAVKAKLMNPANWYLPVR